MCDVKPEPLLSQRPIQKKENITSQWDFHLKQSKLIEVRENKWGQARLVKFPHLIGLSGNKSLFTN